MRATMVVQDKTVRDARKLRDALDTIVRAVNIRVVVHV
jgi:hypothetical protein